MPESNHANHATARILTQSPTRPANLSRPLNQQAGSRLYILFVSFLEANTTSLHFTYLPRRNHEPPIPDQPVAGLYLGTVTWMGETKTIE